MQFPEEESREIGGRLLEGDSQREEEEEVNLAPGIISYDLCPNEWKD